MLKPIINHQKKLNEIYKKIDFLRENFDFKNQEAFFSELVDNAKALKNELELHFNLQINSITHEKAKKFVLENMLVRDMLFRMLDFIIKKAKQNSTDAFLKFDDFEFIIDPGINSAEWVFENSKNPQAIFLTHGHFDHFWDSYKIAQKYNISIYVNFRDEVLLQKDIFNLGIPSYQSEFVNIATQETGFIFHFSSPSSLKQNVGLQLSIKIIRQ